MSVLFAATYPQRTTALVLYGTRARFVRAPDYPWGTAPEAMESSIAQLESAWGRVPMVHLAPAGDERYRSWLLRYQQAAASPAAAVALQRANWQIDVRDILPAIHVPTLVLSRRDDPVGPGPAGRDLAGRITGARFVELDGGDHTMWLGDVEALVGEIEEFLTGARHAGVADRVLATILIADVERSTEHLVRLGDAAWRDLLHSIYQIARRHFETSRGRDPQLVGDQLLALFEGPVRAIRCAQAIQRDAGSLGLRLRAGIHTGEIEQAGGTLSGLAIHIAARVAALAQGSEILVSQTVRDIVAGSGLSFTDRGVHTLKGVPEPRRVFGVAQPP